jgi:hypothetical protein
MPEFIAELENAARTAKPWTRYHEGPWWANLLFYGLPVAFVYIEWRSTSILESTIVLVLSGFLAAWGFLRRYWTWGLFYEKIGGGSFRTAGP